ncbi:MAG: hypothetical protein JNJ41_03985 [Bacteroidia bacterium]|nr:hypothetical protein [Bacteroidia bacterium]
MKFSFSVTAILLFVFNINTSFGQNFKTEVRVIDASNQFVNAGLSITQIARADMDELVLKMNKQTVFTIVTTEYVAEKNYGRIQLKSVNAATIKDFESFLKQLQVYTVVYKNQTISSQEIANNYTEPKKTEIKKIDRVK